MRETARRPKACSAPVRSRQRHHTTDILALLHHFPCFTLFVSQTCMSSLSSMQIYQLYDVLYYLVDMISNAGGSRTAPEQDCGETVSALLWDWRIYTSKTSSLTEALSQNQFCYILQNESAPSPENAMCVCSCACRRLLLHTCCKGSAFLLGILGCRHRRGSIIEIRRSLGVRLDKLHSAQKPATGRGHSAPSVFVSPV